VRHPLRVATLALVLALATMIGVLPVSTEATAPAPPAAAVVSAGRLYASSHQQVGAITQAATVLPGNRWAFVGDISQPTNEFHGGDNQTAELLRSLNPDGICTLGDNQYEYGAQAMFDAETGFNGTYGRLLGPKIKCPTMGNHDMADGGTSDGRAPGFTAYFASQLTGLACETDPTPCRPEQGWYGLDLDVDRNGEPDWYIVAVNTNCQQAGGGTGDTGSPSCANDSPMVNWMRAFMAARHGGCCSGRKASLLIGHHEPFGSCFFANNPQLGYVMQVWQHFHGDVGLWGHTHSTGRWGPLAWNGAYMSNGAGSRHIASGAGGRSLTPCRVSATLPGLRYRNDTKYGVELLTLSVSRSTAGWLGGAWTHEFFYVDRTRADLATAGIWP
jgi:hypothetical protein